MRLNPDFVKIAKLGREYVESLSKDDVGY